jgi:hypothetical protein
MTKMGHTKFEILVLAIIAVIFVGGCISQQPTLSEKEVQPQIQPQQTEQPTTRLGPEIPPEKSPIEQPKEEVFNPSAYGNPHPKVKQSPPPCCNHPYWHKIYRAFSEDGINWQKENLLIKDHASVPAVIQREDGSFILYYVDGEYDTLDCAISRDGKSFSPGNCTIYGFTEERAWDPYVVKINSSYYRMYFFAPKFGGENRIMSAISRDGVNWLQERGVRFQYPGIIDPVVIKMGGYWRMYVWYEKAGRAFIVVARSSDGLNFVKEAEFNVGGGVPEVVKLDSGEYALYFCGNGIEVVTSADGLTWSGRKTVIAPEVNEIVCDPSVIKTEYGWVMYYKVQPYG